jgi:hypothetical protein
VGIYAINQGSLLGTGNYTITSFVPDNFTITAKGVTELTVSGITANNKPYDGNTTATLDTSSAVLVGVISPDVVTLDTSGAVGTFADEDAGTGKTVTISGLTIGGADKDNYYLTQPITTANITAVELTVSGITVNNKVYDGNTTATLDSSGAVLHGVVDGDDVTLDASAYTATFASPDVGNGTAVTVSGLGLSGAQAGNYTLTQPTGLTGNITANDWDINRDGCIDISDLVLVGQHWMEIGAPGWIREDVNRDGIVDISDLVIVGQHWLQGCS